MSVYPEKKYPPVLANNAKLTATREYGDFFNVSVKKIDSKYDVHMQIREYHLVKSSNDYPDSQQ
eukprot:8117255-Ditylum_brightwellii.AAC.1